MSGGDIGDIGTSVAGSKNAVENNAMTVIPTPAGPVPVPIIIPGVNDANANEQIALALENALKNIGKSIKDILNPDGSLNMDAAEAVLSPEQQAQLKAQIIKERESNQIALGKPLVKDMNDYLSSNENGQFLNERLELQGYDTSGNPIYKATSGAGNFINADDQIKLSGSKDALLVYDKTGKCIAALNLDGTRNETLTAIYKGGNLSTIVDKPIQNNTGGYQIPDPSPPLPGLTPPENLVPNNTGHDGDGLDNVEIKHDTGGNQIPEAFPTLPGYEAPDNDWQSNFYISENGDPAFKNGYVWKPDQDVDLRGTGKTFQDALDEAFSKTGYDKSEFKPVRWSKTADGKSIPVQYNGPGGASVNVDLGHSGSETLGVSHIGYKVGTKGKQTGHILVDDVPANRYPGQPLEK